MDETITTSIITVVLVVAALVTTRARSRHIESRIMNEFNSYMVVAYITVKDANGERYERTMPPFHLRTDMKGAPQTAPEAAQHALQILMTMWTPGSTVTSVSVTVGSLDDSTDTYSLAKSFTE